MSIDRKGVTRKKANRLIKEKSPYLSQHAYNPVDWYPWGDEAFEKARLEDKPIFLSVGYSTCHWCHVMAHESFEDADVARLMNKTFISVKVDREERPDIDSVYMTVCQAITGSGGWPLTIIMTPDKKPFFAATYIPKDSRHGRVGLLDLIPKVDEMWRAEKEKILGTAEGLTGRLKNLSMSGPGDLLGPQVLDTAYQELAERFDEQTGGFSRAPKFPTPHNLLFLLRYRMRAGDAKALSMVEKTLREMRLGGLFDHVGFGFHRYSTDEKWLVPHFEKMLYDQAMLAVAYAEAYQATKKEEYRRVVDEILTYVLRDMRSPEGGFYSAEDADSEGVEGKFYLWTAEGVRTVLGDGIADTVIKVFNVGADGNFLDEASKERTGQNILHLKKPLAELAIDLGISLNEFESLLEDAREKLFTARNGRIHPDKDEKILCDWNGLMIAALAVAARALRNEKYSDAARVTADFILSEMLDDEGRLLHRYLDGDAVIHGFLDDYAYLVWGLIELYQTTFDVRYLRESLTLAEHMVSHFWDEKSGGFYLTADYAEEVLFRKKEVYDGAQPSGNSAMLLNLLRLSRLTGDPTLEARAVEIVKAFSEKVSDYPAGYAYFMLGVDFLAGPSHEVVIVGDPRKEDTVDLLNAVRSEYIPNTVVLLKPSGVQDPEITRIAEFTKDHRLIEGNAAAYVCSNNACKKPTTDPDEMMRLLRDD